MLDEIITHPYDETYMSASWSHVWKISHFLHIKDNWQQLVRISRFLPISRHFFLNPIQYLSFFFLSFPSIVQYHPHLFTNMIVLNLILVLSLAEILGAVVVMIVWQLDL